LCTLATFRRGAAAHFAVARVDFLQEKIVDEAKIAFLSRAF
jgi:hypothetical protein